MAEGDGLKHDVYSARQENAFDWDKWNSYDKEWWVQLKMDAKEVRLLYSMISFFLSLLIFTFLHTHIYLAFVNELCIQNLFSLVKAFNSKQYKALTLLLVN